MFYPDQASSFLEFAVTFKGLQSPNTLLRQMHCQLFLILYFQNFEEWYWLAWSRLHGDSVSRSSKNIPVPGVWIQSIACCLKSEMIDELIIWQQAGRAEAHEPVRRLVLLIVSPTRADWAHPFCICLDCCVVGRRTLLGHPLVLCFLFGQLIQWIFLITRTWYLPVHLH